MRRPGPFDQTNGPASSPGGHLPEPLPVDPFPTVKHWYERAHAEQVQPNPNAMTLATIDPDGRPAARIVLCKGLDTQQGFVEFFTNYEGRKGRALAANPHAALVFHWDVLDLQVRIEGPVVRSPETRSDEYFASRPVESRIGAWASNQSQPIGSRQEMLDQVASTMKRFGIRAGGVEPTIQIPRPPNWGGFRVYADRVELWIAGTGRVHDRGAWTRQVVPSRSGNGFQTGPWSGVRLQP